MKTLNSLQLTNAQLIHVTLSESVYGPMKMNVNQIPYLLASMAARSIDLHRDYFVNGKGRTSVIVYPTTRRGLLLAGGAVVAAQKALKLIGIAYAYERKTKDVDKYVRSIFSAHGFTCADDKNWIPVAESETAQGVVRAIADLFLEGVGQAKPDVRVRNSKLERDEAVAAELEAIDAEIKAGTRRASGKKVKRATVSFTSDAEVADLAKRTMKALDKVKVHELAFVRQLVGALPAKDRKVLLRDLGGLNKTAAVEEVPVTVAVA